MIVRQKVRHAQNGRDRRPNLVAGRAKKDRLGLSRALRSLLGVRQLGGGARLGFGAALVRPTQLVGENVDGVRDGVELIARGRERNGYALTRGHPLQSLQQVRNASSVEDRRRSRIGQAICSFSQRVASSASVNSLVGIPGRATRK